MLHTETRVRIRGFITALTISIAIGTGLYSLADEIGKIGSEAERGLGQVVGSSPREVALASQEFVLAARQLRYGVRSALSAVKDVAGRVSTQVIQIGWLPGRVPVSGENLRPSSRLMWPLAGALACLVILSARGLRKPPQQPPCRFKTF